MDNKKRKFLQVLLMSEHLQTGLLAYDLLAGKTTEEKVLQSFKMNEAAKIFWSYVFKGDMFNALSTANEEDKQALLHYRTYMALQSLINADHNSTKRTAYDILSGRKSLLQAAQDNENVFIRNLINNNFDPTLCNEAQKEALEMKHPPKLSFQLNSLNNLSRLNYIMLDQKLTIDEAVNTMVKAFYETIRADDFAELMSDEQPQNFYI